jgi:hypothetical protein
MNPEKDVKRMEEALAGTSAYLQGTIADGLKMAKTEDRWLDAVRYFYVGFAAGLGIDAPFLAAEQVMTQNAIGIGEYKAIFTQLNVTCSACPLQVEGIDSMTGRPLYYRLRHGYWYLEYSDDGERIAGQEKTEGADGSADFEEFVEMLLKQRIKVDASNF